MTDRPPPSPRAIELEIPVGASPEEVWRALTEPEELVKWFPVEARVEPGEGGTIFLSWGEGVAGEAEIAGWEPGRLLRWIEGEGEGGIPVAVEFRIASEGGGARVRLVHSGFSPDADWDEYYEASRTGWSFFLRNLRHYLEEHRGEPGRLLHRRVAPGVSRMEAWRALMGPGGLVAVPEAGREGGGSGARQRDLPDVPGPGDVFTLSLGEEDLAGTVWTAIPARAFAGSVSGLNGASLFIELEPGGEDWRCGVWLYTWGLSGGEVESIDRRLGDAADRLLR